MSRLGESVFFIAGCSYANKKRKFGKGNAFLKKLLSLFCLTTFVKPPRVPLIPQVVPLICSRVFSTF